jgi:hypothetical protein
MPPEAKTTPVRSRTFEFSPSSIRIELRMLELVRVDAQRLGFSLSEFGFLGV